MKFYRTINPINESFDSNTVSKPIIDDMDALYEDIIANIEKDTKVPSDVLNSFKIKTQLNPELWIDGKLCQKARVKLVKIALDFFDTLELPDTVKLKDVILTGSLANYNWSKYSDVDLHLVLDFNQIEGDTKLIEDFFYFQKKAWNDTHDIKIHNYPVEIYVQDIKAKLAATAVYSVLFDKWILKPEKEKFSLDIQQLKSKAEKILNLLRIVKTDYDNQDYEKVVDRVTYIKDKIKNMRTAGLEKGGEFSTENLLFKVLRRTAFMDYLDSFKNKAYDAMMSVAETLTEAEIYNQGGVLFIYGKPLSDGSKRLYATNIKNLAHHNRLKKDNSDGQTNRNAIIGNQVSRIALENGKLISKGVAWSSDASRRDITGVSGNNVGLNYNKTPLHQESLMFNNITQALNQLQSSLMSLPDVRWNG